VAVVSCGQFFIRLSTTLVKSGTSNQAVNFSVEQLSCIRQDRCLFEDLSFSLASGQIIQIEGPNGAGKSSLLRILGGFLSPESGQLLWQNEPLGRDRVDFNQQLLFIGHQAAISAHMTALENVNFWLELHPHKVDFEVFELLGRLGLVGLEDIPVSQLSAGQQRKVALARLWLTSATLWILDEPFTAIDKKGVAGLQRKFQQHLDEGGMIILTTHQDLTAQFTGLKTLKLEYRI
jgi:heme exporter protein A